MKLIISLLFLIFINSFVLSIDPIISSYRRNPINSYTTETCSPVFDIVIEYKSFDISNPAVYLKDLDNPYSGFIASVINGTKYLYTVTHNNVPIGKNQSLSLQFQDYTDVWKTWNFTNYATVDCEGVPTNLTMKSMQDNWVFQQSSSNLLAWQKIFQLHGFNLSVPSYTFSCDVPYPFYCYGMEYLSGSNVINYVFQIILFQSDASFNPFNVVISDKQGRILHSSPFDGLGNPANPPPLITNIEPYPANNATVDSSDLTWGFYFMNILNKNTLCNVATSDQTVVTNALFPVLGTPANATYIGYTGIGYGLSKVTSHLQIVDSQGIKRIGSDSEFSIKKKEYDAIVENVNVDIASNSNINKELINIKADVTFNPQLIIASTFPSIPTLNSIIQSYPFAFSNGTVKYYSASTTFEIPKYSMTSRSGYVSIMSNNQNKFYQQLNISTPADTKSPELIKVELQSLSFEDVITRVYAKDLESGILNIYYRNLHKLTAADLVYGDQYNGVYESVETLYTYLSDQQPTVVLNDAGGNSNRYDSSRSVFSTEFASIPYYPLYNFVKDTHGIDPYNFTAFEFKYNDVDVSNGPFNNTLCFNFAGSDKNMVPRFVSQSTQTGNENDVSKLWNILTVGVWDNVKNMFCIDFEIPARTFSGNYQYGMFIVPYIYDSFFLEASIGKKAQLRVTSSYGDQMPPIITEFTAYPSNNVAITQNTNVGWNIKIEDSPNGLLSAEFNITSDYDLQPHTIKLTPSKALTGNLNSGTYQLRIPITASTCRAQSFKIVSATIIDTQGHSSFHPSILNINPLIKFLDSDQLILNITCPQAIVDNTPPILTSFTSSINTIDVGTYKDLRAVTFTFTTSDSGSGISSRHNPIVYLTSNSYDMISQVAQLLSISNGISTYTATIQLPYGYGAYQGILISIYGIVDNQLNINGYSTLDLQTLGFQNTISVTYSDTPVLDSTSLINSTGTSLTINGHKFGIDKTKITLQVDYNKGQGWINTPLSFFSGIILMTNNIVPTSTPFYVRVIVNGKISNSLLVVPSVIASQCKYEVSQTVISTWINSEKYPYLQAAITIKNTGNKPIKLFSFVIDNIDQIWGVTVNNNRYTLPSYNEIINPHDQYSFGYIIKGTTVGELKDITYQCLA